MATESSPILVGTLESRIRNLSSIKERSEALSDREKRVKASIVAQMTEAKLKAAETIYGNFILREDLIYDFSQVPEVVEAELRMKEAEAALKAAKEVAQPNLTPTIKVTPVFNRNKAVSARTKKGHVYVATTCSPKKKTKSQG